MIKRTHRHEIEYDTRNSVEFMKNHLLSVNFLNLVCDLGKKEKEKIIYNR